jgi:hypothetical protein
VNRDQFEPDANETFRGADARTLSTRSRQDDAPAQLPPDSAMDTDVAGPVDAFLKPLEKLLSTQARDDLRATLSSDEQCLSIMSFQVWTALEYMVVDDWAKNQSKRLSQTRKADVQFFKDHLDLPSRFKSWPLVGYAKRSNWSAMQRRICVNADLRALFDEFNTLIRAKARRDIGLGASAGIPVNQTICDVLSQSMQPDFLELYDQFHSVDDLVNDQPRWNHVKFREKALAFAKHFTKAPRDGVARERDVEAMYSSSDVTPYLHAMVWHWPQLMQAHGLPIASFSCSGLEKKNHMRASLCLIVCMRRDLCELIFFLPVLTRRPIRVFSLDVSQRRH